MIRDRKMYVAPTPFGLLDGVAHQRTLVVPESMSPGEEYVPVGDFVRIEAERILVAYSFDLRSSRLSARWAGNPARGRRHCFRAYRLTGDSEESVSLRQMVS
jgi:hypothetical protein